MSTIVRTRSPYFIRTTNYASPTYSIDYFQIAISIYEGTSGSLPTCGGIYGQYTLKKKVLPGETSVTFDISEIANDHLIQTFSGTHGGSAATQSFWMQITVTGFETDGSAISPNVTNQYLIQEGFNKFKEGVNYVTEPTAMITANYMQYNKGSNLVLPVNPERVNSVAWKLNGSTIATTTVTDAGNSEQKIQYISKSTTSQEYDQAVVTYDTSSTRTITIEQLDECKYPVNRVTFLNRWGAMQDLFFFKKSTESLDTRRENFNRSIFKARTATEELRDEVCETTVTYNSYSTTSHADKSFNANGRESILLNSGFVPESMNETFEELMVSEYVWITDPDDVVIPVKVKDTSFAYKTGLNDKLINYTMNFEKAFDLVNNIR
tara:strand:+ start:926 stop:2062 length:1137 start_codon:yes stop_codon:yes gene_type:complete